MRLTTPPNITRLRPDEIFVFGSNTAGRHGKGAALQAKQWGAVEGVSEGLQGQTYAIPTRRWIAPRVLHTLPPHEIEGAVARFLQFAQAHPELIFFVTEIGCGYAGYQPKEIAPMFHAYDIPPHVTLPGSFWRGR